MNESEIRLVLALEEIQHDLTFDINFDIPDPFELSSTRDYHRNYSKGANVRFTQNPHRYHNAFDYVRYLAICYQLSTKIYPGNHCVTLEALVEDICDAICVVDRNLQALCKEVKNRDILRCKSNLYFGINNVSEDIFEVLDVKYLADDCISFGKNTDPTDDLFITFHSWDEELEHQHSYMLQPKFLSTRNQRGDKRLWSTISWLERFEEVGKVWHGYVNGLSVINTAKLLAGGFKLEGK